jgi:hypothetical protein
MSGFAIALVFSSMLLHPAQETLTELQFNEKTQRVEIAMRLSALDEQSLAEQHRKAAKPTLEGIVSCLRLGSIEELQSDSNERADRNAIRERFRWVGRQEEGGHVWCYLEYTPPMDATGAVRKPTHACCTLFEQERLTTPSHAHEHAVPIYRFTVLSSDGPKSFSASPGKPIVAITW